MRSNIQSVVQLGLVPLALNLLKEEARHAMVSSHLFYKRYFSLRRGLNTSLRSPHQRHIVSYQMPLGTVLSRPWNTPILRPHLGHVISFGVKLTYM